MKHLYNINKVVIIINLVLVIIPFLGLVFLLVTGFFQVISFIACLIYWKRIDHSLRKYFIAYPFLAGICLGILAIETDVSFTISLSLSALLALSFLFLLKKQKDITQKNAIDSL
ncbi:hypothetical protein [uncultured Dokdonia sp.]|uniref:hypothetical protein n=1 Tax=uncultured Dokdonia sp. TaxID=575653 RepID=UPI00262A46C5|nr:hypothetical protein [uncultured Dokdonia sp.]